MEKALKSEPKPAASREWKESVFEIQDPDFPKQHRKKR